MPRRASATAVAISHAAGADSDDDFDDGPVPSTSNALTTTTAGARQQQHGAPSRGVPAFLTKLYLMVDSDETDELIRWGEEGTSFVVPSSERLGHEMLPQYFKHSNFGSFVRQLNMYGFRKVPRLQAGALKHDTSAEVLEFRSDHFKRGQPELMSQITRKRATAADQAAAAAAAHASESVDLPALLQEVAALRSAQTAIGDDLATLARNNKNLWSEAMASRARHKRHQDTINKIVRFLGTVFGGRVIDGSGDLGTGVAASPVAESPNDAFAAGAADANVGAGPSASTSASAAASRPRLLLRNVPHNPALEELDSSEEIELPLDDELPTISSADFYDSKASTSNGPAKRSGGYGRSVMAIRPSSSGTRSGRSPQPLDALSPPNGSSSRFTAVPDDNPFAAFDSLDPAVSAALTSAFSELPPASGMPDFSNGAAGPSGTTGPNARGALSPVPSYAALSQYDDLQRQLAFAPRSPGAQAQALVRQSDGLRGAIKDNAAITADLDHVSTQIERLIQGLPIEGDPSEISDLLSRIATNQDGTAETLAAYRNGGIGAEGQSAANGDFDLDQFLLPYDDGLNATGTEPPAAPASGAGPPSNHTQTPPQLSSIPPSRSPSAAPEPAPAKPPTRSSVRKRGASASVPASPAAAAAPSPPARKRGRKS